MGQVLLDVAHPYVVESDMHTRAMLPRVGVSNPVTFLASVYVLAVFFAPAFHGSQLRITLRP